MPCHGPQDLDALVFKCQNDDASGRSFLQLICAFLRSVVLYHIGGDLSPDNMGVFVVWAGAETRLIATTHMWLGRPDNVCSAQTLFYCAQFRHEKGRDGEHSRRQRACSPTLRIGPLAA